MIGQYPNGWNLGKGKPAQPGEWGRAVCVCCNCAEQPAYNGDYCKRPEPGPIYRRLLFEFRMVSYGFRARADGTWIHA